MAKTVTKSFRLDRASIIRLEKIEERYGNIPTTSILTMMIKEKFEAIFETTRLVEDPQSDQVVVYSQRTNQQIAQIPIDIYEKMNEDLRFRFENGLVTVSDAGVIGVLVTASLHEEKAEGE